MHMPDSTVHYAVVVVICQQLRTQKKPRKKRGYVCMAERVGFEPTEGRPSTVFKTVAFDHSATSPNSNYIPGFQRQLRRPLIEVHEKLLEPIHVWTVY